MIVYIYDIKTLELIAKPVAPSYLEFKSEPGKFYPAWNNETLLATETLFQDPIIKEGQIREKTREEQILLDNKIELLQDGEYIKNNEIVVVEAQNNLFKKVWNKTTNAWEEGATKDDVDKEMNRLIDEFIELSEQKEKYIKYGFETFEIEKKIEENIAKRDYLSKIGVVK